MRNRLITNKQAAVILNMPISTFNAKVSEMGLARVSLFPGRKGWRLVEIEVLAVAERAIAERDKQVERTRKAIDKAACHGMK